MQTTEVVAVSTNVEFSHTSCMFFYVMIINAHGKLFCHSSEFEKFKFVSVNKFEEVFSQIFFWPFSLRICICLFCFVFFSFWFHHSFYQVKICITLHTYHLFFNSFHFLSWFWWVANISIEVPMQFLSLYISLRFHFH